MNIAESLNIVGKLTVQKKNMNGEIIEEVKANNSITTAGRDLVATLFNINMKPDLDLKRVTKIGVGSGPKTGEDSSNPADTELKNLIGYTDIKKIDQDEKTKDYKVPRIVLTITGELGMDDCNGELKEAGLFTKEGIMYNRVHFPAINKTSDFKLTLIWEIIF